MFAKLSDAILCNSKNGYDYWYNKVKSSKIHIIPNGLPLKLIRSVPSVEAARFSKNGPTLLCAGRLVEGKNIDLLIKALADSNKRVNINCIICGEGDLRLDLIDLAKQLGLEESIRFIGHMPQISMWGLMKTVTGYVSLSAFEGCPNTTLEAMAIGVPVFLSNITAHLEIADEDNAIIIGLHDISNISAAFEKYLFDAETLEQRSKNAYERVTKFSIENMVNHHESIYYKLN